MVRTPLALVLALVACDYHERLAPTVPRAIATSSAEVALHHLGYDHTTLSVTVDVTNRGTTPLRFDPAATTLQVGMRMAQPITGVMGASGARIADGAVAGAASAGGGGSALGVAAGSALGIAGGAVDAIALVGINELVRGPYTRGEHVLAPHQHARYTMQYPLQLVADDRACVPPYDDMDRCTVTAPLRDGLRLDLGRSGSLPLLDVGDPHLGLGPPSPPGGVYEFRIGGGPGIGRTEGVVGLEMAAGPRWGSFALTATAALGFGFPLGAEAHYHVLDRGPVHLSTTLGEVYWFFPGHHATGPRAGVELGLDLGESVLSWRSSALQMGLYARGGPVIYGDETVGGELDFGMALGIF